MREAIQYETVWEFSFKNFRTLEEMQHFAKYHRDKFFITFL